MNGVEMNGTLKSNGTLKQNGTLKRNVFRGIKRDVLERQTSLLVQFMTVSSCLLIVIAACRDIHNNKS